jgi:hypothetical protein
MSMNYRIGLVLVTALAVLPPLRAAEVEERQFAIALDGQRVGEYRMKITKEDDGSVVCSSQGQMQLSQPGVVSKYRYRGSEVWKDGKLLRLDSTAGDDVKQTTVSAAAEAKGVRVSVGGNERVVPGPVWVTTYWQLPAAAVRSKQLTLLDADNGSAPRGGLERVGTGQVIVGGQPTAALRYRLTGGANVDLWYDADERLVRQEWTLDGHRVALELLQVKH